MSEEQARQRAQELTKKALAEAENETFKIDRSLQGKHIVTKSEKGVFHEKMEKIIFTGMRFCYDIFTKYNGICGRITKNRH